jgi:flagellar M-ring protein FliF
MDILEPIVGAGNVRAQVTADLDFTISEATAELYKPNQAADSAAVRSRQSVESMERDAAGSVGGVPGALINQPPADAKAPINGPAQATQAASGAATTNAGESASRRETLTNYEVDKTVRVTRNPTGTIKRLSVAVLVNQRQSLDGDSQPVSTPLTQQEMTNINALVRDAVGYSQERGDSLNVVNAPFTRVESPAAVDVPLWKQPENIAIAKDLGKQFGFVVLALLIILMLIRPALKAANRRPEPAGPTIAASADEALELPNPAAMRANDELKMPDLQQGIGMTIAQSNALQLARADPTAVATVVKEWINSEKPVSA